MTSLTICLMVFFLLQKQDGQFAIGFSGDTKGGGKTAYDVLPPKPIKK